MHKRIRTPIGPLRVVASEKGISVLSFSRKNNEILRRGVPPRLRMTSGNVILSRALDPAKNLGHAKQWITLTERALRKYFQGDPRAFQKIPVDIKGTVFQKKVWRALKQIPAGKTLSYGAIATRIGHPKAFRAVGTACGSNPVALLVPCHRAVGSGKSLGGFAWGIQRKKKLLRLENPKSE